MESPRKIILIIDDEQTIGEMIQDYLKTLGFNAFYADNAEKGIEILKKEKRKNLGAGRGVESDGVHGDQR